MGRAASRFSSRRRHDAGQLLLAVHAAAFGCGGASQIPCGSWFARACSREAARTGSQHRSPWRSSTRSVRSSAGSSSGTNTAASWLAQAPCVAEVQGAGHGKVTSHDGRTQRLLIFAATNGASRSARPANALVVGEYCGRRAVLAGDAGAVAMFECAERVIGLDRRGDRAVESRTDRSRPGAFPAVLCGAAVSFGCAAARMLLSSTCSSRSTSTVRTRSSGACPRMSARAYST